MSTSAERAVLVGLLAAVVATAGAVSLRLTDFERDDPTRGPDHALRAWFDAVESGSADRVRAIVAPSQRDLVDPADPGGLGRTDLRFDQVRVREQSPGPTDDGALVEIDSESAACPPGAPARPNRTDDRPECFSVTGSGPSGQALVVREQGRWWTVAQPVRLLPRGSDRGRPRVQLVSRLVLSGGLSLDQTVATDLGGHTCRNLRGSAFQFRSDSGERVQLSLDGVDVTALIPGERLSVRRDIELLSEWSPAAPVRLTRAADGSSGSLALRGWQQDPQYGRPEAPVSGELTWSCRDRA